MYLENSVENFSLVDFNYKPVLYATSLSLDELALNFWLFSILYTLTAEGFLWISKLSSRIPETYFLQTDRFNKILKKLATDFPVLTKEHVEFRELKTSYLCSPFLLALTDSYELFAPALSLLLLNHKKLCCCSTIAGLVKLYKL